MKYLIAALMGTLLIPVPQLGNASLIEIIWFVVGVLALTFSAMSLPSVIGDLAVARAAKPSPVAEARVLLARGHVRREVIRLAQATIILAIGGYSMVQPNLVQGVTLMGLVLTTGLVLLAALVAVQSGLDRQQRKHAEQVLADQ